LSTIGQCPQVPDVGPYTGGFTGRISRIDKFGNRSTVADKLPSSQANAQQGSLVSSVGDVAFIGNTLYAVLAGAGCSHGLKGTKNGVIKVNPDGTWTMIADLSDFQMTHPVADISATQGHIVPTAVAYHGNFYVGNLNTFPIQEGSSKILKIMPS
jgi:hypothetical protein